MDTLRFDGKRYADTFLTNLAVKISRLQQKPVLGIILVGKDPASLTYIKQKMQRAKEIGAEARLVQLGEKTTRKTLLSAIKDFNGDSALTGYIIQLPLPGHLDYTTLVTEIDPQKDIDAFHPLTPFTPPIVLAVRAILAESGTSSLSGKRVLVLGKGPTAGTPIAIDMIKSGARVVAADKNTPHVPKLCEQADIIVSCTGARHLIRGSYVKTGAVVIGIGIGRDENGKLYGDVDEDSVQGVASFYTPTPGGVGPLTVAMLLSNLYEAARR